MYNLFSSDTIPSLRIAKELFAKDTLIQRLAGYTRYKRVHINCDLYPMDISKSIILGKIKAGTHSTVASMLKETFNN